MVGRPAGTRANKRKPRPGRGLAKVSARLHAARPAPPGSTGIGHRVAQGRDAAHAATGRCLPVTVELIKEPAGPVAGGEYGNRCRLSRAPGLMTCCAWLAKCDAIKVG